MHGTLMAAKKLRPTGPYRIGEIVDYAGKRENATCQVINLTEPDERRWYVVQVEPQQETAVSVAIQKMGMGAYCPCEPKSVKINAVRRRTVMRPLLIGYIFAAFDIVGNDGWMAIPVMRGVLRLFMVDSRPLPVPNAAIEYLRQRETELALRIRKPSPIPYRKGQWVQLCEDAGPWSGCFGLVDRLLDEKQKMRVLIDVFGRQTPVEVSVNQVRAV